MSDVVDQGGGGRRRRPGPSWSRRATVGVLLVALGGWWAVRAGALPWQTGGESPDGPLVVTLEGSQLVLRGSDGGRTTLPLPAGLGRDGPLLVVEGRGGPAALVGVGSGTLYRVEPRPGGVVSALGPAAEVLAASPGSGQVLAVVTGPAGREVVAVRAATGAVVDREPFPGFAPSHGRTPRGALTTFGPLGLLMSRSTPSGGEALSVAWARDAVQAGWAGQEVPLDRPGRLLGISGDWVLVLHGRCPGAGCRLEIVTVRPHGATSREVAPPSGWSFAPGPVAGRSHEVLVPIERRDSGDRALARLVSGGDNALLVGGTSGMQASAGMVEGAAGSVYLAVARPHDGLGVRVWRPGAAGSAEPLPTPPLPRGARLVCVCG